jgi:hypothetical protein
MVDEDSGHATRVALVLSNFKYKKLTKHVQNVSVDGSLSLKRKLSIRPRHAS